MMIFAGAERGMKGWTAGGFKNMTVGFPSLLQGCGETWSI